MSLECTTFLMAFPVFEGFMCCEIPSPILNCFAVFVVVYSCTVILFTRNRSTYSRSLLSTEKNITHNYNYLTDQSWYEMVATAGGENALLASERQRINGQCPQTFLKIVGWGLHNLLTWYLPSFIFLSPRRLAWLEKNSQSMRRFTQCLRQLVELTTGKEGRPSLHCD